MRFLSLLVSSISAVGLASALGQERVISFKPVEGGLKLAGSSWGSGPGAIYIDSQDWPGVLRAGQDLADDFGRVVGENGLTRELVNGTTIPTDGSPGIIIAGTIGKSRLIDTLVENEKIDVSQTEGKWEAFQTQLVSNPVDGVAQALVISGSDKRGTIYGLYDISEQIGVSPWYWWADVASDKHDEIFAMAKTKIQGSPSVKYRGFFLNDEQPALTNWVNDNYPKSEYGPGFNSDFYATVFELLLRLRANYLWPAMWDSMIALDDQLTLPLADSYGIVMGTSHTEPLMAQTKEQTLFLEGDWNWDTNQEEIYSFLKERVERSKNYESVFTMGMRGLGDTASPTITAESLAEIVKAQQQILGEVFNTTDVSDIPQMWCVYKEVGGYFEDGMVVPEDITILWPDDNWGNAQRLPLDDEVDRASGAGLYYHFDYVGDPMDYKWINTISLQRSWEQLRLTYERQARQIWIVNVGDLKPLEVPISHYFDLAYDMPRWSSPDSTSKWLEAWATREFGADVAEATRKVMDKYSMYAGRRKYELLETRTYSLLNYNEAERVSTQWKNLVSEANEIYNGLSSERQPAFFELVLHPCMAGQIVTEIHITAGKNNLYASQKRTSANALADDALNLFKDDHELTQAYHTLLDGKWKHMMDQTHIGYTYWQQPMRNTLPPLAYTQLQEVSLAGEMGVSVEGSEGAVGGDDEFNVALSNNTLVLPPIDPYGPSTRWIEIYSRGTGDFDFSIVPDNPWVIATPSSGSISAESGPTDTRVQLSIDWENAPEGSSIAFINILIGNEDYGNFDNPSVHLPVEKTSVPSTFHGFVESDRTISIEAAHTSRRTGASDNNTSLTYTEIPGYGRTFSGITLHPATLPTTLSPTPSSPHLEYDIYTFTPNITSANVTIYLGPSLNTNPDRPLKYAIAFDDAEPEVVQFVPSTPLGTLPDEWGSVVSEMVWKSRTGGYELEEGGEHTLRLWAMEAGVVFEKVVIDLGGVRDSYLGPPESVVV